MISMTAQYAVRAVMHLAREGGFCTAEDLARKTGIVPGYLAKILSQLAKAGLLTSQRGSRGGFRLAVDAQTLSVLTVVRAVDAPNDYAACNACHAIDRGGDCAVNRLFAGLEAELGLRLQGAVIGAMLTDCAPA